MKRMLYCKFFTYWILFITFLISSFCYCNTSNGQNCDRERLTDLCEKLSLSHFSEEERISNIELHKQAYTVILSAFEDIEPHTDTLLPLLHLTYKLVNSFQQSNRGAEGEIVLRLAYQTLEKCFIRT